MFLVWCVDVVKRFLKCCWFICYDYFPRPFQSSFWNDVASFCGCYFSVSVLIFDNIRPFLRSVLKFPRTSICLNLPPRSHIDPSHFRKINWFLVRDRLEYCIANTVFKYWNGIALGYIHEMFKLSLYRYSTRSQVALDIPLQKTNRGQKKLILLRAKNMVQNMP